MTILVVSVSLILLVITTCVSAVFGPILPQGDVVEGGCAVRSYVIRSDVHLRYATTLLQVRVVNPSRRKHAPKCLLRVMVPEAAFVSGLLVEVGIRRVLQSVVTARPEDEEERENSKVSENESKVNDDPSNIFRVPRDSKLLRAMVSLNPREEATFYITYEQLLARRLGIYEIILNLHPGQIVPELRAEAYLYESQELAIVRVPALRSGHEIDPLEVQSEFPLAKVRRPSLHEAHVTFTPTQEQQRQMANSRSWISDPRTRNEGVSGQLVVQFELKRTRDGEITIYDGFFAHHYAPTALSVLPKHVVFVLDLSHSMTGRKIQQLKTAMIAILDELRNGDFFSIIQFNSLKSVWSPDYIRGNKKRTKPEDSKKKSGVLPVTRKYITKAKRYIRKLKASGGTNIQRALVKALDVAHTAESPLSLVVLLTDGETTVGDSEPSRILQAVRTSNRISNSTRQIPIYSLAFGVEADYPFLRRLSAENYGFARRIYNADDAALQIHEVFAELSSPILADLTFHYPDTVVDIDSLTQRRFAAAYLGSELVVAGRLLDNVTQAEVSSEGALKDMWGEIQGRDVSGTQMSTHLQHVPPVLGSTQLLLAPLSRLWAYLSVQQLLLGAASSSDARQRATELSIKYSFVTATTTLTLLDADEQPARDNVVTISLPAKQEVGSEARNQKGNDSCEGGEFWSALQQVFIPCATTPPVKLPHRRPHSSPRNRWKNSMNVGISRSYELITLDKIRWLPSKRYEERYLVLPKGRARADQLFWLGLNETNVPHAPCFSPINESSHCRHMHFCVLQEFAENFEHFLNFFCAIQNYAGVCCPDSIFADQSTPFL